MIFVAPIGLRIILVGFHWNVFFSDISLLKGIAAKHLNTVLELVNHIISHTGQKMSPPFFPPGRVTVDIYRILMNTMSQHFFLSGPKLIQWSTWVKPLSQIFDMRLLSDFWHSRRSLLNQLNLDSCIAGLTCGREEEMEMLTHFIH